MKTLDLGALDHEAEASWSGVLDLAEVCPTGWSLAGGQSVYVQAVLRGSPPPRPSSDADVVIDLRADPGAAERIVAGLVAVGFEETRRDGNGRMHRWVRGDAQIDVLQPRFLGPRLDRRLDRQKLATIGAPGAQHLLTRTEQVQVTLGGRTAEIRTPTALGVIVAKAAAFTEIIGDAQPTRHLADILTLAPLLSAKELRAEAPYNRLEHERVGNAIGQSQKPENMRKLQQWFPDDLDQRIEAARKMHAFHAQPRSSFPKVRSGQAPQSPTAPPTMRF